MKIQVTQKDIDDGFRWSTTGCPVALAIERTIGAEYASVGTTSCRIALPNTHSWEAKRIDLPYHVGDWIRKFDTRLNNRQECKPFEFELDYPVNEVK